MGRPDRTEDVGVVPREGGVALLDVLEGGRLEGVVPRGGVMGGVAESLEPRKCGFLGGLSGGMVGWSLVALSRLQDCCSLMLPIGVPLELVVPLKICDLS